MNHDIAITLSLAILKYASVRESIFHLENSSANTSEYVDKKIESFQAYINCLLQDEEYFELMPVSVEKMISTSLENIFQQVVSCYMAATTGYLTDCDSLKLQYINDVIQNKHRIPEANGCMSIESIGRDVKSIEGKLKIAIESNVFPENILDDDWEQYFQHYLKAIDELTCLNKKMMNDISCVTKVLREKERILLAKQNKRNTIIGIFITILIGVIGWSIGFFAQNQASTVPTPIHEAPANETGGTDSSAKPISD